MDKVEPGDKAPPPLTPIWYLFITLKLLAQFLTDNKPGPLKVIGLEF
jgi:hypothetical protein